MVEIRWTSQSIDDIENIGTFITGDSKRYAEIQIRNFFEAVTVLETFPRTGRIVPEVNDIKIRELIIGSYRIIYKINNSDSIDILTVFHSSRLLTKKKLKEK